jgi:hypothetical protein
LLLLILTGLQQLAANVVAGAVMRLLAQWQQRQGTRYHESATTFE